MEGVSVKRGDICQVKRVEGESEEEGSKVEPMWCKESRLIPIHNNSELFPFRSFLFVFSSLPVIFHFFS